MTTEPDEPSDADLVVRARAGDVSAFGALVRRYQTSALRLAAAVSGSVDDAADIAQEAFVKAHRSLPKLTDPTTVKSWMLRIVANEAKNHVRGRNRRRRRDERYGSWVVAPAAGPEDTALTADDASPAQRGARCNETRAIDRCLATATSLVCRKWKRRVLWGCRSEPSSRELRGHWPSCASSWTNHDRSRTVARGARPASRHSW